jgi:hypothetical protein
MAFGINFRHQTSDIRHQTSDTRNPEPGIVNGSGSLYAYVVNVNHVTVSAWIN